MNATVNCVHFFQPLLFFAISVQYAISLANQLVNFCLHLFHGREILLQLVCIKEFLCGIMLCESDAVCIKISLLLSGLQSSVFSDNRQRIAVIDDVLLQGFLFIDCCVQTLTMLIQFVDFAARRVSCSIQLFGGSKTVFLIDGLCWIRRSAFQRSLFCIGIQCSQHRFTFKAISQPPSCNGFGAIRR